MTRPIVIGVSACLLGERVRYDGGHKYDSCIADTLGGLFRLVAVCPEVECGMPTPREAMQLEGDPAAPRLMTRQTRLDLSDRMLSYCSARMRGLEETHLSGFILKKGSPSCGLFLVGVFDPGGGQAGTGSGLFAAAVARHFPLLPLEEEGRLNDPAIREDFIERVIRYSRDTR